MSKRGGQGVEADTPDSPAPGNQTGGTTEEYPTWHDQRRNLEHLEYMAHTEQRISVQKNKLGTK